MSHPIDIASSASKINSGSNEAIIKSNASQSSQTYKGFIAGVFSGVAKLTGEQEWHQISSSAD